LKGDTLNAVNVVLRTGLTQSLLRKFEARLLAIATNSEFSKEELQRVFPESVQLSQLGSCISFTLSPFCYLLHFAFKSKLSLKNLKKEKREKEKKK
jgi:hypothetical protein